MGQEEKLNTWEVYFPAVANNKFKTVRVITRNKQGNVYTLYKLDKVDNGMRFSLRDNYRYIYNSKLEDEIFNIELLLLTKKNKILKVIELVPQLIDDE